MKSILSFKTSPYDSPLGKLWLSASDQGLSSISWSAPERGEPSEVCDVLKQTKLELDEYFEGLRNSFSVNLAPQGTDFQMKVWRKLQAISYGSAISYKELAIRLEKPGAQRAVGSANGKNPLPIIIPCHRVIASNGGPGGYRGGLAFKRKLLELEGIIVS